MDGWPRKCFAFDGVNDMHGESSISKPLYIQDSLIVRSTKSYMIANCEEKDTAFLKEKCRQAGLDLGLVVVANRIPTDSKLVSPKPSKHLLKQGVLHLQLPMNDRQDEFAVYLSEIFKVPSSINVLQIDDELVTYRSVEKVGNIHLFYHVVRGAFGTKKAAHGKDAAQFLHDADVVQVFKTGLRPADVFKAAGHEFLPV